MRIDQNRWQLAVCFFAVLIPSACLAENWPQFRGAEANGVANSRCPVSWSATGDSTKNVRWKVPIAGEGWSAPVVWGKQVFLTAAVPVASANGDAARTPRNDGRRRDDPTQTVYRYQVRCLDANTGETLWTQTARQGRPPIPRHSQNSYATETPITDGERLYAYFGMNGVYCYDLQGELQWKKDLGAFKMRAGWQDEYWKDVDVGHSVPGPLTPSPPLS